MTSKTALAALESLERAGVRQLGKSQGRRRPKDQPPEPVAPSTAPAAAKPKPPAAAVSTGVSEFPKSLPAAPITTAAPIAPELIPARPGDTLSIIQAEVAGCVACQELASTRTQTVFGVGNPQARLCFLGEAPGADEDAQGEPFVGRAGQLLTKIIEACTLTRQDVYILNVLKCRPPGNRNPLPHEVANCRGFLDRQLALIKPEFICCLGTVAAHTLLETETPIGKLRGKFVDYKGIAVMCTYHPAYLLRNPSAKKEVWADMKTLMRRMGIELD